MINPFRTDIGPYSLHLPGDSTLEVAATRSPPAADQIAITQWTVALGRFHLFIHLDARHELGGLKDQIEWQTRGDAVVRHLSINNVPGVSHGGYGPPRTRIDWWFKQGDTMICLSLQSVTFPVTEPTTEEAAEHQEIIGSLTFIPSRLIDRPKGIQ